MEREKRKSQVVPLEEKVNLIQIFINFFMHKIIRYNDAISFNSFVQMQMSRRMSKFRPRKISKNLKLHLKRALMLIKNRIRLNRIAQPINRQKIRKPNRMQNQNNRHKTPPPPPLVTIRKSPQ